MLGQDLMQIPCLSYGCLQGCVQTSHGSGHSPRTVPLGCWDKALWWKQMWLVASGPAVVISIVALLKALPL